MVCHNVHHHPHQLVCGDASIHITHFPPCSDKTPGRNSLREESFICTEDLGEPQCQGTQLVSAGWNRKQTAWATGEAHSSSHWLPPVRLKATYKGITTSQSSIVVWGQVLEHTSLLGEYFTSKAQCCPSASVWELPSPLPFEGKELPSYLR